jgi:hypothetical protein
VIQEAAYIWPLDPSRMIQVARSLNENNFLTQGLKVAEDAVKAFPNTYDCWATLYLMNAATEQQKGNAIIELRRLDPNNPELK